MQSDIILHKQILALIPEFQNKLTCLQYFVVYERPKYQRTLYEFWCKTLDKVTENILKVSQIAVSEFESLFKQFEYQPMGLQNILLKMKKHKLIIANNIMQEAVKIVLSVEQPVQEEIKKPIKVFWNPMKKMVQNIFTMKQNKEEEFTQFLHIKFFRQNVIRFRKAIEQMSLDNYNTFTILQLQNELELPKREIQFLIKVFQQAQLIQFVGYFKLDKIKQEVYIYKSLWLVDTNLMELTKHQTQFKLKCIAITLFLDYEMKLNEDKEDYYNQIEIQNNLIRSKLKGKRSAKEIKFHIAFKIQYEKLIEKMEQKLLVIQQNQVTLNVAETDLSMQEIIGKVCETIQQLECDTYMIEENLNIVNQKQKEQEELVDQMKIYTNDGVEELYNQYFEEQFGNGKQISMQQPFPQDNQVQFVNLVLPDVPLNQEQKILQLV